VKTKEAIEKIKKARNDSKTNLAERNNINFYTVVVFEDEKDREEFHKAVSVPICEQYMTAEQFRRLYRRKED
jgi:hypothetical protein